ncbi:hypothetical protein TNCV_1955741 [Trichonephila clavipes]|nr:hypothetical protein TNCV_1955741 [Trichonephila clavipes]
MAPGSPFSAEQYSPTHSVFQDYLHHVSTLPWLARSSNFSQIELIWDHLGLQFGQPTSLGELEMHLQ